MSKTMRGCVYLVPVILIFLTGCDREERVVVDETRGRTTKDVDVKLYATSDERFRDAKPSPVKGVTPEGWLELPARELRVLNYRFGKSATGEVYVSISGGSVGENVERWMKQFGKGGLGVEEFRELERVEVLGREGVLVEAEGDYNGGPMGGGVKSGYALAGVVVDVGGKILTVKMLGLKDEVELEKGRLREYVASLEAAGE